jgi:spoIIIJ-associated protein
MTEDAGAGAVALDDADADAAAAEESVTAKDLHEDLVAEGDAAGDYLERLLDILDYDGDIDKLVGEHGEVLSALQELTRLAAGMETGTRSRLMLDIAGFRARRREELTALGRETAQQVVETGRPARLGAMNPFERKVVHDAVATVPGAVSASEGEEPRRRVVVSPAD